MRKKLELKTKEEIEEIVNVAIKENQWDTLTSKDYGEYVNVTAIGKEITVKGKKISGMKINEILEEMKYITRDGKRIVLTEKGKEFGRYAIAIKINSTKPIITDNGYAKYKKTIIPKIKEYLEVKSVLEENKKEVTIIRHKEPIEILPKPRPVKIIYSKNEEEKENGTK